MRQTTAFDDNVFSTSTRFCIPARSSIIQRDVLTDASLSVSEKRAILASWASDAFYRRSLRLPRCGHRLGPQGPRHHR